MSNRIVNHPGALKKIYSVLQEAPLVALRSWLTDQKIIDACAACNYHFRDRQYGPVVTILHFLTQAIHREDSFQSTWQEIWTPIMSDYPEIAPESFNPSGLSHARRRLPEDVLHILTQQACNETRKIDHSKWRGFRLLALDGSTVSMPRTPELIQHFGVHKTRTTTSQYPLATIGLLLSVGTSMVLDYQFGPHDPGENKTCYPLYENLCPGDLLLADRGFAGSPTLARVMKTGANFLMRKNARLIVTKLPVLQRIGKHDFVTEIPMNRPARKKDPSLPETVRVRIFRATWETPAGEKVTEWFVTSLMDSKRFKKKTLAKLYHERWQVETSYLEIKQIFHADVLRSKKVENIYKEFSAHVLAYQLLRIVINSAAQKHEKKPTQISVINAARWITSFSHRMAASPAWALPIMYERLLDAIASTEIYERPGRLEPRARCRETKHYPRLKTSRAEWRKKRILRSA